MKHNTGNWDRSLRAVAGVAMITCGILAPLPFVVPLVALGRPHPPPQAATTTH